MARDQVPAAGVPTTFNVTLDVAGVEESFDINVPDPSRESIKKIQVKSRTSNTLQYGWAPGGPYTTIPIDQTYYEDGIDVPQQLTIYLVGSVNGQIAEIEVWR